MTVTGFRPQGSSGPKYNPERDFAYITGTLLKAAIENLDMKALRPDQAVWFTENHVTEAEVVAAVDALSKSQRDFVKAYDPVTSFEAALSRHGFFDVRYPVRQFLFAAVGEVMCSAWFTAVREVSNVGFDSPAQDDMARFASAARDFCRRHGALTLDDNKTLDVLRFENDVLKTQISEMLRQLSEARNMKPCRPDRHCSQQAKPKTLVGKLLSALGLAAPTDWVGPK